LRAAFAFATRSAALARSRRRVAETRWPARSRSFLRAAATRSFTRLRCSARFCFLASARSARCFARRRFPKSPALPHVWPSGLLYDLPQLPQWNSGRLRTSRRIARVAGVVTLARTLRRAALLIL
jgi:hypothetical protein